VNLLEDNIDTVMNTQTLINAGKEVGLEIDTECRAYHDIANRSFKNGSIKSKCYL
jgi:hypothetical protein